MQTPPARTIRVFSGTGRYRDPWHPFEQTSAAIAAVATDAGHSVEVTDSDPAALTDLTGVDLVVINSGGGDPADELNADPAWEEAFAAFGDWLAAGHPVLGVHTAANAFPDWPQWPGLLGGQWIRDRSMHPERSEFTFTAAPGAEGHPALGGLTSVTTYDERYSYLDVHDGSVPLLQQRYEDIDHVMVWARPDAPVRAVYDGLGHGPESYESAERRRLLAAEIGWLLG